MRKGWKSVVALNCRSVSQSMVREYNNGTALTMLWVTDDLLQCLVAIIKAPYKRSNGNVQCALIGPQFSKSSRACKTRWKFDGKWHDPNTLSKDWCAIERACLRPFEWEIQARLTWVWRRFVYDRISTKRGPRYQE